MNTAEYMSKPNNQFLISSHIQKIEAKLFL